DLYFCLTSFSFFFFFSSRRRHTRSLRDWSSDVCSSDLPPQSKDRRPPPRPGRERHLRRQRQGPHALGRQTRVRRRSRPRRLHLRSEERRVGKECRSRWSPCN